MSRLVSCQEQGSNSENHVPPGLSMLTAQQGRQIHHLKFKGRGKLLWSIQPGAGTHKGTQVSLKFPGRALSLPFEGQGVFFTWRWEHSTPRELKEQKPTGFEAEAPWKPLIFFLQDAYSSGGTACSELQRVLQSGDVGVVWE